MKKVLKWTAIVFGILIIIIVSISFLFKNKIIEFSKAEANKQLNARLNFGEIDVSFISSFPDFKLSISNLCISGINDFEKDTLAFIGKTELNLDLMSVIKGEKDRKSTRLNSSHT